MSIYRVWVAGLLVLLTSAIAPASAQEAGDFVIVQPRQGEQLLAFVGRKQSVRDITEQLRRKSQDALLLDGFFRAKYRVEQVVYGEYAGDVIEFTAADHYGRPRFEQFEHVMLFVSAADDGGYFHEKYQFYPVFRTRSGAWAACAPFDEYDAEERASVVGPHPIDFGPDAYFRLGELSLAEAEQLLPAPQFRIEGRKAYCTQGNTTEELLRIKQRTVLKARGLFVEDEAPADAAQ